MTSDQPKRKPRIERYQNDLSNAQIENIAMDWVKYTGHFEFEPADFLECVRAIITAHERSRGDVVITRNYLRGDVIAVTRQDEEGQIINTIWKK